MSCPLHQYKEERNISINMDVYIKDTWALSPWSAITKQNEKTIKTRSKCMHITETWTVSKITLVGKVLILQCISKLYLKSDIKPIVNVNMSKQNKPRDTLILNFFHYLFT